MATRKTDTLRKMLQILLVLVCNIAAIGQAIAQQRSEAETEAIARSLFGADAELSLVARLHGGLIHVYARGRDEGWVMTSADVRGRSVLAYAENGIYAQDSVNFSIITDEYIKQILQSKNRYEAKQSVHSVVAPMLKTKWGQGEPYNNLLKNQECGDVSCGCIGLAMAQLMYYHRYPTNEVSIPAYIGKDGKRREALTNRKIRWDDIKCEYKDTDDPNDESVKAVAELIQMASNAAKTTYNKDNTIGAEIDFLQMVHVFGYDDDIQHIYVEDGAEPLISKEIDEGRPVFIEIATKDEYGHAFICDGRDAIGLYHANLGWYGLCDCYLALETTDDKNVTNNFGAFIGIMKPDGKRSTHVTRLHLERLKLQENTLTYEIDNRSGKTCKIDIALAEIQGTQIRVLPNYVRRDEYDIMTLYKGSMWIDSRKLGQAGLRPGKHKLTVVYKGIYEKDSEWHLSDGWEDKLVTYEVEQHQLTVKKIQKGVDGKVEIYVCNLTGMKGKYTICLGMVASDGSLLPKPIEELKEIEYNDGECYKLQTNCLKTTFKNVKGKIGIFCKERGGKWRNCHGKTLVRQ